MKKEEIIEQMRLRKWNMVRDGGNQENESIVLCPHGHNNILPLKKLEKSWHCKTCWLSQKKERSPIDFSKPCTLALDAATITTGYSIFQEGKLCLYGTFQTKKTWGIDQRFSAIAHFIKEILEKYPISFVGIEDVHLETFSNSNGDNSPAIITFKTLCMLRGFLIYLIYEILKRPYLYISVAEWRSACHIEGKKREEKKASAIELVKAWYNIDVTDDEAEAILLGYYLTHKQGEFS